MKKQTKRFNVSLNIQSGSASLAELTAIVGIQPSSCSMEKGSPRRTPSGTTKRRYTIWCIESKAGKWASLEAHLKSLVAQFPLPDWDRSKLPADSKTFISIGVFFDQPMCSLNIQNEVLTLFAAHGFDLQVACYPCYFEA